MWHVSVCSKYSVSPLSSKNDLKITLKIAFCFENIIKKEHSETLFISCYIIAKKLSSSFRKTWLNKKIYCKIALTSRQQTIISWCVLTQIFFYIILSVIRQKGESQSGCFKKTKHVKCSEKRTFLTPCYAHIICFLETHLTYCLINHDWYIVVDLLIRMFNNRMCPLDIVGMYSQKHIQKPACQISLRWSFSWK